MSVTYVNEDSPRASGEIPYISEEELQRLHTKYTPLIPQADTTLNFSLYRLETPDLRRTAYTWSPKLFGPPVEFQEVFRSQAAFPCGYAGFFKPSIAEVLCQIPEQLVITKAANAYYIDGSTIKVFSTGSAQLAEVVWGRI